MNMRTFCYIVMHNCTRPQITFYYSILSTVSVCYLYYKMSKINDKRSMGSILNFNSEILKITNNLLLRLLKEGFRKRKTAVTSTLLQHQYTTHHKHVTTANPFYEIWRKNYSCTIIIIVVPYELNELFVRSTIREL